MFCSNAPEGRSEIAAELRPERRGPAVVMRRFSLLLLPLLGGCSAGEVLVFGLSAGAGLLWATAIIMWLDVLLRVSEMREAERDAEIRRAVEDALNEREAEAELEAWAAEEWEAAEKERTP